MYSKRGVTVDQNWCSSRARESTKSCLVFYERDIDWSLSNFPYSRVRMLLLAFDARGMKTFENIVTLERPIQNTWKKVPGWSTSKYLKRWVTNESKSGKTHEPQNRCYGRVHCWVKLLHVALGVLGELRLVYRRRNAFEFDDVLDAIEGLPLEVDDLLLELLATQNMYSLTFAASWIYDVSIKTV